MRLIDDAGAHRINDTSILHQYHSKPRFTALLKEEGRLSDSAGIYPGAEERQDCSIQPACLKGMEQEWDLG